jgi:hypothetical protein
MAIKITPKGECIMSKVRTTLNILAVAIFTLTVASMAQAQATRTWVSGVGDDVNPCSRTAPCKTFAGAISKTAAGGEISVLDPGGFGTLTITKSITVDGGTGSGWASVLASATTGFTINATGADDRVVLRNISINGALPQHASFRGVRIVAAKSVHIENCQITGFRGNPGRGIEDVRSVDGDLYVSDTVIRNNAGSGIVVLPSSGTPTLRSFINNCQIVQNGTGAGGVGGIGTGYVLVGLNLKGSISNSNISKNTTIGIGGEGGAKIAVTNCIVHQNGTGIDSNGAATAVTVARTNVHGNTTNGLGFSGGTILSYGNNEVSGNTGNNGPFSGGSPTLQ